MKYDASVVQPYIRKKKYGLLQAFEHVGGVMALVCGVSVIFVVQLIWNLLSLMTALVKQESNDTSAIPQIETRDESNFFKRKLHRFKKDLVDFLKMSSIHGCHNLSGGFLTKVFWFVVISVAAAACAYFVSDFVSTIDVNQINVELDETASSSFEVFLISFPNSKF